MRLKNKENHYTGRDKLKSEESFETSRSAYLDEQVGGQVTVASRWRKKRGREGDVWRKLHIILNQRWSFTCTSLTLPCPPISPPLGFLCLRYDTSTSSVYLFMSLWFTLMLKHTPSHILTTSFFIQLSDITILPSFSPVFHTCLVCPLNSPVSRHTRSSSSSFPSN